MTSVLEFDKIIKARCFPKPIFEIHLQNFKTTGVFVSPMIRPCFNKTRLKRLSVCKDVQEGLLIIKYNICSFEIVPEIGH